VVEEEEVGGRISAEKGTNARRCITGRGGRNDGNDGNDGVVVDDDERVLLFRQQVVQAASGTGSKWYRQQVVQAASGYHRLQVVTTGCKWLPQAASGYHRLQVVTTGCKWLPQAASGNHRLQVVTTGCKWYSTGSKASEVELAISGASSKQ